MLHTRCILTASLNAFVRNHHLFWHPEAVTASVLQMFLARQAYKKCHHRLCSVVFTPSQGVRYASPRCASAIPKVALSILQVCIMHPCMMSILVYGSPHVAGCKAKLSLHMGELVESDFTHKSENTQTKKQSRPKVGNSTACQMWLF